MTENPANEVAPAWSPDGERLAYQSNRNGTWELFVADVETGTETQITFGATGGAK